MPQPPNPVMGSLGPNNIRHKLIFRVLLVYDRQPGSGNGIAYDCRVPNRPAHAPQHKITWNCSYTHTLRSNFDHSYSLHKVTGYIFLYLEPQKPRFQKIPNNAEAWGHHIKTRACARKDTLAQACLDSLPRTHDKVPHITCNKYASHKMYIWSGLLLHLFSGIHNRLF